MARHGLLSEPNDEGEPNSTPANAPLPHDALDRMWIQVHHELRRVAHGKMLLERDGHSLSTTALLHETYLKLAKQNSVTWGDRNQFFGLAAQAMRRILIDSARRHRKLREQVRYDSVDAEAGEVDGTRAAVRIAAAQRSDELIALDEALERLEAVSPRLCRVVECRYFAGLTDQETAGVLGVTARTVGRDWAEARKWLFDELHPAKDDGTQH